MEVVRSEIFSGERLVSMDVYEMLKTVTYGCDSC